jgi:hypothetical protein
MEAEVAELRRQLEEARQREAEARQREAEARQREATLRQERAEARKETQSTTFDEYLKGCHDHLFSNFAVQTDKGLTTKGLITNPRDKWCPTELLPWTNVFLETQRQVFGRLYQSFPASARCFSSLHYLKTLGAKILAHRAIGDEKTLELFMHISVEASVREIVQELCQVREASDEFSLGDGVIFENHPHVLSDNSRDVLEEVADPRGSPKRAPKLPSSTTSSTAPSPPSTPQTWDANRLRPDQICIFRSDAGDKATMIYVCEYKPPHKLTARHITHGLRPMNILNDVVNRKTIPMADEKKFQYNAEKLTAAALTQTYSYMIESGLEYGLLTTGEMIVFLKIDWNRPQTLLYHLSEPRAEVEAHPTNSHLCSAVGQYLSFTLMALEGAVHGQEERRRAMTNLRTWTEDFETTRRSMPDEDRRGLNSSGYEPVTYSHVDRSPYILRNRKRQRLNDGRDAATRGPRDDGENDDDIAHTPVRRQLWPRGGNSSDYSGGIASTSKDDNTSGGGRNSGGAAEKATQDDAQEVTREPRREYCTQECLLGLVRGLARDPRCPNAPLHTTKQALPPASPDNDAKEAAHPDSALRHPINHAQFLELLQQQLQRTLDDDIVPLGKEGARGVLLKATLREYGYTFVGKGTVQAFIRHLEHEAAVYERLRPIQGVHVPVFLGAVDLRPLQRTYYYAHRVYIVHMTFMSWGGLDAEGENGEVVSLSAQLEPARRAIRTAGVIHNDLREPNILFNEQTNSIMIIDFERATMLGTPRARYPLATLTPNKRRRTSDDARYERPQKQRQRLLEVTLAS